MRLRSDLADATSSAPEHLGDLLPRSTSTRRPKLVKGRGIGVRRVAVRGRGQALPDRATSTPVMAYDQFRWTGCT